MEWNIRKDITKKQLEDLYVSQFLGTRKIAEILKTDRNTIKKYLKKYNIPIRFCRVSKYFDLIPSPKQEEIIYGSMLGDSGVYAESEGKHTLFFNKVNSWKLINIISPYIIPSMKYKINLTITPQRLQIGLIRENKMIQSELYGDIQSTTEMFVPAFI